MISFRISIIGFECFGLFRISSFGIRIFIRERLGAKNFLEVVLLNILSVRIYYQSDAERPDLAFTLEAEDLGARFR